MWLRPHLTAKGLAAVAAYSEQHFHVTPGVWRKHQVQSAHPVNCRDRDIIAGYRKLAETNLPKPTLVDVPPRLVAYMRHRGYDRSIAETWQKLLLWASAQGYAADTQLGLHHSNPVWTELEQCRYVACLGIDEPLPQWGLVNQLTIPGGF